MFVESYHLLARRYVLLQANHHLQAPQASHHHLQAPQANHHLQAPQANYHHLNHQRRVLVVLRAIHSDAKKEGRHFVIVKINQFARFQACTI